MTGMDWQGLMRVGLHHLGLEPAAFWRLTPVELRIMLGTSPESQPLTRSRLAELASVFPDKMKDEQHGTD